VAYSNLTDLEALAGTAENVVELADRDGDLVADTEVIELAQSIADSEIDSYAARLYGKELPFGAGVLADVPRAIRALAAQETLYQLKVFRRVNSPLDDAQRAQRERTLAALEAGRWYPRGGADPYPIGDGGGTPVVVVRSGTTGADRTRSETENPSREDMEGWW
jgi:hypothetical protein